MTIIEILNEKDLDLLPRNQSLWVGSVLSIIDVNTLSVLQQKHDKLKYRELTSLSFQDAKHKLMSIGHILQSREKAVREFRSLVENGDFRSVCDIADRRKTKVVVEDTNTYIQKHIVSITGCFSVGEQRIKWTNANSTLLYSLPRNLRAMYILSFFHHTVSLIETMIQFHDVMFQEIHDLLLFIEEKINDESPTAKELLIEQADTTSLFHSSLLEKDQDIQVKNECYLILKYINISYNAIVLNANTINVSGSKLI